MNRFYKHPLIPMPMLINVPKVPPLCSIVFATVPMSSRPRWPILSPPKVPNMTPAPIPTMKPIEKPILIVDQHDGFCPCMLPMFPLPTGMLRY